MAGGLAVEEGGADACCGCGPAQIRDMRSCACHIGCEIVPPALCKRLVPRVGGGRTIVNRFLRAGRKSVTDTVMSRYLCASIVYVAYTALVLYIDINAFGGFYGQLYTNVATALDETTLAFEAAAALVNTSGVAGKTMDDDLMGTRAAFADAAEYDAYLGAQYAATALSQVPLYTGRVGAQQLSIEFTNQLFIIAAVIHFINAWQYVYAWHGRRWNDIVIYPEYMNVIGSWLYLIAATWYTEADALITAPRYDFTNGLVMRVHYLETAAASWELFAAFGWAYTYWKTFPRKPGRGCTLDDPDIHGTMMIVIPSFIYLAYNIQLLLTPADYGANTLYIVGDAAYFAGSVAYLLGALRDAGWLWWMPRFGRFPDECPAIPACCGVESEWPPRTADEIAQLGDESASEEEGGGGGAGSGKATAVPPGLYLASLSAAGGSLSGGGAVVAAALGDEALAPTVGANPMAAAGPPRPQPPRAIPAAPKRKGLVGGRGQIDF